ncbi:MAG: polysaccharide pyruvyl transferase family protein [Ramlibacter sp.]
MSQFLSWSQDWIKAALPRPVLEGIRAYRHKASVRRWEAEVRERTRTEWRLMLRNWKEQAAPVAPAPEGTRASHRILVFPSDPGAIVGSRGDDAMITAVLEAARSAGHQPQVDMFCEGEGERIAVGMGFHPVVIGTDRDVAAAAAKLLGERRYDTYVALGADIVDGRFGPRIPALMLIAADLAARAGVRATILGCSFGEDPAAELKPVFQRLDWRVHLNMRDPISLRRLQAFAPVHPQLVADAAFLLEPGSADPAAAAWVERQRALGRKVVGVNAHPMLVRTPDAAWVEKMAANLTRALCEVGARRNVGWILLPHDYREHFGDLSCLRRVGELLRQRAGVEAHLLEGCHSAADLKALVGGLDAVVTGRMHLAIAALGMGVPALALTYHDKFEGLYSHFELPPWLLLSPAIFDDPVELARRIEQFVEAIPVLVQVIEKGHARVMALARKNFMDEPARQD